MWHSNDQEKLKNRINYYKEETAMINVGVKIYNAMVLGMKPKISNPEEKRLSSKFCELMVQVNELGDLKDFMEREYPSKKKYYARHQKFYIYVYNGDLENAIKYHDYINQMNLDQMEKISSGELGVGIVDNNDDNKMEDYGNKEEGYIQMCDILKDQFKDRESWITVIKEHIEDAK